MGLHQEFDGVEELSATKMVEHYMILYNNMVAKFLYENDRNTILRTHKVLWISNLPMMYLKITF